MAYLEIPGQYQSFSILPYKSVHDIMPDSRRSEFLQQVQCHYTERNDDADNPARKHQPFWTNQIYIDSRWNIPDFDPHGEIISSDPFIQGIMDQRKLLVRADENSKYELWSNRLDTESAIKDAEEATFREEMQRTSDREKREDAQERERQDRIDDANINCWEWRKEVIKQRRKEAADKLKSKAKSKTKK